MQLAQIDELYSLKTYWVCFVIVAVLTAGFLVGFGVFSHRYRGKVVYEGLTRIAWGRWRARRRGGKEL
jgi:hypothetical protein